MDFSILSTLAGLTVFVFCFRPLMRRAGPHVDTWFAGWTFLLLHYTALMFPSGETLAGQARDLISLWGIELCGLSFLLAAGQARRTRANLLLTVELALPVLLQSWLYITDVNHTALRLFASLLFAAPALHLLLYPPDRSRHLNLVAGAFTLFALGIFRFNNGDLYPLINATLFMLFLGAAYLTAVCTKHVSRGAILMIGGLGLWALSYILQATGWPHYPILFEHAVLDLPRYLTAGGMILSLFDEYTARSESLALHDPLTDLPNRRHFDTRLNEALDQCAHTGIPIACLVIDVDHFKLINDTFGHAVGDGLLQALAKRLSWNLGPNDMLARTGGDEFTAILVEAADEFHIRFIAGAMMAAGCVPVAIGPHLLDVHISIGIAVAPRDGTESADLQRTADEAMYRAKRRGGGGIAFAHEEIGHIHAL